MSNIRVGTSGWSYPSGKGTWNGVFYPVPPGRRSRGPHAFDELRFYAEHFDTVEINSTFYGVPTPATTRGWCERTPPGFLFSLKLFQKFTHPDMFQKATGRDPWSLGQKDVDDFRAAMEPLAAAGKLGPLLAQFPASFHREPATCDYLQWLLERFRDYAIAVELRHGSWSDHAGETTRLLEPLGAAWAQIDEPKFRTSIRQNLTANVGAFFYLRLHGRNAAHWWKHAASEDRYNYLYSTEELKVFAEAAGAAQAAGAGGSTGQPRKAYLYTNNHFSAKSVANAAILKHELKQDLPGEYPTSFLERYPDLKGLVRELRLTPSLKPS